MAQFLRGTNNTILIPEIWKGKDFFKGMFTTNPLAQYMGKGDNVAIMTDADLTKQQGDRMTIGNIGELTGSGQGNDGAYDANPETMAFAAMTVTLAEHGHSVRGANGDYSAKSAFMNLKVPARMKLQNWAARMNARYIIDGLSGLPLCALNANIAGTRAVDAGVPAVQIAVVNQVQPSKTATSLRYYCGGQVLGTGAISARVANPSALNVSTNFRFGTKVIEEVKRLAIQEVAAAAYRAPIAPFRVDGGEYYLMLIDPLQGRDLRADASWLNSKYYADVKGKTNPLFSGALGIWDGVVIRECPLIHRRTGAGGATVAEYFDAVGTPLPNGISAARALFIGAQAGVLAYGEMPKTEEGYTDPVAKSAWQAHARWIAGFRKTAFVDSQTGAATLDSEYGCIIVDTCV